MRRRIWWQIRILDIRTSETHGSDQEAIHTQHHFETKVPLNIDDEDLIPGSVEAPVERIGITEMSVMLLRYETLVALSRLLPQPIHGEFKITTVEQIDQVTEECRRKLEDRFLRHCNMEIPWHWLIATVSRMMLARMWVSVHHRFKIVDLTGPGGVLTKECRDRLFPTSIEIVESCLLLERNESTKQWEWCSRNFIPWQAMAFILSELCIRERDKESDRAWIAVQGAFDEWADVARNPLHDLLWSRMQKLFEKVRRLRVSNSNKAPHVEMTDSHEIPAESTMADTRSTSDPNATGVVMALNNDMELYYSEHRSSIPGADAEAGPQWQYMEESQIANIGPDVVNQFDWDVDMDFLPTAGTADVLNGNYFEELDNWW